MQIILFFTLFISSTSNHALAGVLESLQQVYGKEYGVDWMFFPDDTGEPHYVSLKEDRIAPRTGWMKQSDSPGELMEFRYYVKNPSEYIILDENANPKNTNESADFHFKPNTQLKIITHGFRSSADSQAVTAVKDAYLNKTDYNVVGVDWNPFADNYYYIGVADQTKMIGNVVGSFLKAISEKYNVSGADMHLIGHSLGSHVMGNAALASQLRIGRITGLDPARPCFENNRPLDQRLDDSDAEFVDAIHTCSGLLGFERPIGHADFYPNGGTPPQPGCTSLAMFAQACSHGRSYLYFAESIINPDSFPAYQCDNVLQFQFGNCPKNTCYVMGENVDKNVTGKFFLHTNPDFPYGKNACT